MWGSKTKTDTNLVRLSDSGSFKVAQGDFDVRGWPVIGSDGEKIGKVHDLVFDKVKEKVRYLEIDIDTTFPAVIDKNILVPIGLATIHGENRVVAVKEISQTGLKDYPPYNGEKITRDYEYGIRDFLLHGSAPAQGHYTDRLSPQRQSQEAGKIYSEQDYHKIVHERDLAVSQRDQANEETNRIKKDYNDLKSRYSLLENKFKSNFKEEEYNTPAAGQQVPLSQSMDDSTDDFYSNRYFDCDEFEKGVKC
jgi:sporulation protein YlmC with PRC-barrel domain